MNKLEATVIPKDLFDESLTDARIRTMKKNAFGAISVLSRQVSLIILLMLKEKNGGV